MRRKLLTLSVDAPHLELRAIFWGVQMFKNGLPIVALGMAATVFVGGCQSSPPAPEAAGLNSFDTVPSANQGAMDMMPNGQPYPSVSSIYPDYTSPAPQMTCPSCPACPAPATTTTTLPVTQPAASQDIACNCKEESYFPYNNDICFGLDGFLRPIDGFRHHHHDHPYLANKKTGFGHGRGDVVEVIDETTTIIEKRPNYDYDDIFRSCSTDQAAYFLSRIFDWDDDQERYFRNGCFHHGHCGREECYGFPLFDDYYGFGRFYDRFDRFDRDRRGHRHDDDDYREGHGGRRHHHDVKAAGFGHGIDGVRFDDDRFGRHDEYFARCGRSEGEWDYDCFDGFNNDGDEFFDGWDRDCEHRRCHRDHEDWFWHNWEDGRGFLCGVE
jgi:hypothetical protein